MKDEVCVKISGLNLTRIIDRLVAKNILVKDLVCKQRYIKFVIDSKYIKELNKICKIENKYYEIQHKNGFKQVFFKSPYMVGTILALIITLSYLMSFSIFVFRVDLTYNSNLPYDLSEVNAYLKDNGIENGMRKADVDISKIQNMILLEFGDIAGCTVKISGGRLSIIIYPAAMKDENKDKRILSKYDAIITKAVAYSGELKVKEGDIVRAGDVLIESEAEALGEVEGRVYFTSSIIYNERQQYLERTGNSFTYNNLLFINKFRIYGQNKSGFLNYESEIRSFYLNANLFIPIIVEKVTIYEVEVKEKIVPFSTVEKVIMDRAYDEAFKKVPKNEEINNVTYSVVTENNYTRVDCFIEVIMSII